VDLQFVVPEPALLKPEEIRLKLLEPLEDGSLLQWLFTTEDTIQIGRDANNNARLDNPRVSRRHAVISHDGRQWQYENLGSNGTLHNGENVEQFTVGNGDVIQLAVTGPRIQFELP
jgi:pSer/pThr/pTyr-binding forkhead associated (FHA) protein